MSRHTLEEIIGGAICLLACVGLMATTPWPLLGLVVLCAILT